MISITQKRFTNGEIKEAKRELKKLFKKTRTIYQTLTKVSNNGMYRHIKSFVIIKNEIHNVDYLIVRVLAHIKCDQDGIGISGFGMDMGLSIACDLGRILYPSGFRIRKQDTNRNAINGMTPSEKGYNWDNDGGNYLKQKWI